MSIRWHVLATIGLLGLTVLAIRPSLAGTVVADLSNHLIGITAAFDGSDVLVFGTLDDADDVAVVIRGPSETVVVREKRPILGIWLNRDSLEFEDVPGFYTVAASRPLQEILAPSILERHGLGLEHLPLHSASEVDEERLSRFREALIRTKQRERLFPGSELRVRFVSGGLFRSTLPFPSTVPPGRYQVEVLAVRDGRIVAAQQSALVISKIGVEARISDFAQEQAAIYALGAIAVAVAAGWSAALAFRRS
ncbi:MAG: TIGR02186 family protein [Pseudomonadota bacterium]